MRVSAGDDAFVSRWVADRIGADDFGPCATIAVLDDDGALLGGVVFNQYSPENRTIHLSAVGATPRWLNRSVLSDIFAYPFNQLEVNRITCLTGKKNRRARQFLERFGFRLEGCIRRGLIDQDLMIYGLLREEWKAGKFNAEKGWKSASSARSGGLGERSVNREHGDGARAAAP